MGEKIVIRARGLRKSFGPVVAVDGIDFEVREGECFAILGPNGAGKTSTMRMLYDFSPRDGGELEVFGLDPAREGIRLRQALGVVQQSDNLDQELTVRENLEIYAGYYGLRGGKISGRIGELLEYMELDERAGSPIKTLSGGMKRRLAIVRALVHGPRLVIMDEPTTGLDPHARHQVWAVLRRLARNGLTVVLSTHYMDEAERLCDRLTIMDRGGILDTGAPDELIRAHLPRLVLEMDLAGLGEGWERTGVKYAQFGERVFLMADTEEELSSVPLVSESVRRVFRGADLEDLFLELTGRRLSDE